MHPGTRVGPRSSLHGGKQLTRVITAFRPEIIAHGALEYSRSPIVEDLVITQYLGLGYIGNYTKSGRRLKRRNWRTGIGWFLSEVGRDFVRRELADYWYSDF